MNLISYIPNAHVWLVLLGTLGTLLIGTVIRRVFFHPLSKYPGPWLGKFTDLVTVLAVARQARAFRQYELLQKYGSPMRMGTNHLVFSDGDSITAIYGQSSNPCPKDPEIYNALTVTGGVNLLNSVDRVQHARLRRLLSNSFSVKSLLEEEQFIQAKIDQYLSIFQTRKGQSINILERTYELFLDLVSQLSFGESFDCLSGQNPTANKDTQAFFTVVPTLSFAPSLRYLPIKSLKEGMKGLSRLEAFSRAHVAKYVARSAGESNFSTEGKFLQKLATAIDPETGTKFTEEELVDNSIIFLTAGSGTTASTVTYTLWECGKQPSIKKRLIDEIRAKFPDPKLFPTYQEVSQLKYFNNVLEEILRLRGPINSSATRLSPGKQISKNWVPPGIKVEANIYATARDPKVFPDPETFNPSRWEHATEEMRHMSRPFSYGPHNCVGRHLAEINISLTLARIYQLYDIVPSASITDADMAQVDFGVFEPGCKDFFVTATPH